MVSSAPPPAPPPAPPRAEALRTAALALLPAPLAHRLRDSDGLGQVLEAHFESSAAARAAYGVEWEALLRALVRPLLTGAGVEAVRPLAAADLVLALACAAGQAAALAELERRFVTEVTGGLRRVDPSPGFVDEALQAVRERLLLPGPDGVARISTYAGTGSLSKWVGAVALRVALNLRGGGPPQVPLDAELANELPLDAPGPELALLKQQYREAFQASFSAALSGLSDQDVNVLRLHYVGGVSLDQLGVTYGVHRATVARWIARSKELLLQGTQRELRARLTVDAGEFDSIMELIRSQLALTLSRVLS